MAKVFTTFVFGMWRFRFDKISLGQQNGCNSNTNWFTVAAMCSNQTTDQSVNQPNQLIIQQVGASRTNGDGQFRFRSPQSHHNAQE